MADVAMITYSLALIHNYSRLSLKSMPGPQSQPEPRLARTTTMFTVDPYYSSLFRRGGGSVTGGVAVKVASGSSACGSSSSNDQRREVIYVLMAAPLWWLLFDCKLKRIFVFQFLSAFGYVLAGHYIIGPALG